MSLQALGRRRFLAGVAGIGLSAAVTLTGTPATATLPSVNMEYVVVQSQVEPGRSNSALPGDDSVRAVQSALRAKGFGTTADGWFGSGTAEDYAAWQRRLGYTGLAANGIPGPTSLTKLGENRYTVVRKISVGGMTTYSGKTVNQRTRSMLAAADAKVPFSIVVSQGSYNAGGVAASAGTHDGGGAVDISVSALTSTQRWQAVAALRTVGFAAWLRTPSQGDWPYHIHAIAIGDTDLSTGARAQVKDYYGGLNGLASHAADNTPSSYRRAFTWWEKYLRS
jgi:peptidoglycan hydrolase-like protein with peptidoglycan-binding domain